MTNKVKLISYSSDISNSFFQKASCMPDKRPQFDLAGLQNKKKTKTKTTKIKTQNVDVITIAMAAINLSSLSSI